MFQKETAAAAVQHIRGVREVFNHITVRPRASAHDVRERIVKALQQNADVDARHVTVTVSGDTARLTGTVGTWLQRDAAEQAAADAPGIGRVDNQITVQSFHDSKIEDWDEIC
jgi:osmotically-inducible protein OsmY